MALSDILFGAANAARSFIRPARAADVVAITGAGFSPIFADARPMSARIFEAAEVMTHPLETGAKITDHIVFQPVEIDLPLYCIGEIEYRTTYAAIKATYLAGERLTVRTRTGSYPNMVISEIPHEETPEIYDGISIRLHLVEAMFVTPESGLGAEEVKDAKQASTVSRGSQQTRPANAATAERASRAVRNSGLGKTRPLEPSVGYKLLYGDSVQ